MATDDEPGAVDNRLTVDINNEMFDGLGMDEWQNGETYTIPAGEMRQVAPGEFEIISVEKSAEAEPEPESEGPDDVGAMDEKAMPKNPAVRKMMRM